MSGKQNNRQPAKKQSKKQKPTAPKAGKRKPRQTKK